MPLDSSIIARLRALQSKPRTGVGQRDLGNFNKAALFLLDMGYENLFEPARNTHSDVWLYNCKGCSKTVKRTERKEHHASHKRELRLLNAA
jgi:hypothetical protein